MSTITFVPAGQFVEEPFVVGDPAGGVVAAGGLQIGPGGEHAHPVDAERLQVPDVGAEAVGEHDPGFGGARGAGGDAKHKRHQDAQQCHGQWPGRAGLSQTNLHPFRHRRSRTRA